MTNAAGLPVFGVKAELFKTLAHPTRIRALEVLADGERSVSDLAVEVEVELPHLSQQLAVLRKGGLVDTRREATTVYYAIRDPLLVDLLAVARRLLISGLEGSTALLDDLRAEDMP